jgi:hypothetical protein
LGDDLLSLFILIEGFHRLLTGSLQPAIFSFCIEDLDPCRISQDERSHVDRRRGSKNWSAKTHLDEQRQTARVVQVAMGEQNGVEFGIGPDWRAIQGLRLPSALKHSTIH